MAVTTKAKGGREDLNLYDGKSKTFSRLDSTGGSQTITKINDFVDVLQVYGSGANYTIGTLDAAIKAVGSSNVELYLSAGNWVIDSNFSFPSTATLVLEHGCYFTISSSITLTLNGPLKRTRYNTFRGDGDYTLSELTKNSLPVVQHSTTVTAKADTTLIIGEVVHIRYYSGTNLINADYDVVAASTGTHDGFEYHSDDGSAGGSVFQLKLRIPPIVNALMAGIYPDGSTTNDTQAQILLTNARVIRFPKGSSYYKFTTRLTAPANTKIYLEDAELRWTATVANGSNLLGSATRPGIEVTGNNFTLIGNGTIKGPSSGTYVANECGIYMTGTDTDTRASGLYIYGKIDFNNWGAYPIAANFVDDIEILGPVIHDSGYIGIHMNSCNHGRVQRCEIYDITPGTGGEMHGISLSHDSTDYNLDANASSNGRLAANPFCQDWDISYNTVYNIVSWTGIDSHGGYEINVHHNNIYNCLRGVQVASGSGDAINYAGEKNSVCYNNITPRKKDGSATGVSGTEFYGITVNGGVTVEHRGVRVIGNEIDGCGDTTQTSAPILCSYVTGAIIMGNVIRNWAGPGIYTTVGDGIMIGNRFGSVSNATAARCIRLDSNSRKWTVVANTLELNGGTAPSEGLRTEGPAVVKHTIEANNFDAATTPYVDGVIQTITGSGAVSLLVKQTRIITGAGAAALTLADGVEGDVKYLVMTTDGGGTATLTPTNLLNGSTITFDDVGDSAHLVFLAAEWVFMGGTATLA